LPGYYCDGGATSPYQNIASKGHYTLIGATEEIECPVKFYNPYTAQSACLDCKPGFYCDEKGMAENIKSCPTGNYCPLSSELPLKCPVGTFNNL